MVRRLAAVGGDDLRAGDLGAGLLHRNLLSDAKMVKTRSYEQFMQVSGL
jgi:hypothetical protein